MAIDNFVPELWAAAVQAPFEAELVYAQSSVSNREYEGQIQQKGDTVHITTVGAPTIRAYDKSADITVEDVEDGEITLVVDQGDYFAFKVQDIDRQQAAGDFQSSATTQAGYGLKDKMDRFVAGLIQPGVQAANKVGRAVVVNNDGGTPDGTQTTAWGLLVALRQKLDKASVPSAGRYVVVPPEFISAALFDSRFVKVNESGTDTGLRNGIIARAAGFDILQSNNVPTVGGSGADKDDLVIAAGIPDALSVAQQLVKTEALRMQTRFADMVRGLNVYGGKLTRANGVATATARFAPGAGGTAAPTA